jgi:purine-binding chemotaxis protein CheW
MIDDLNHLILAIDKQVKKTYGSKLMDSLQTKRQKSTDEEVYIIFSLENFKYALPIDRVLEIGTVPKITPIPKTPNWLLGVTNLRGDIFSVVDLQLFLGLGKTNHNTGRMMLVRTQQEEFSTILIVDQVNGLFALANSQIKTSTSPIQNKIASFLIGFCTDQEKDFALLDIEKLLNSRELRQFEYI